MIDMTGKNFFVRVISDATGEPDDARIMGIVVILSFLLFQLVAIYKGQVFSPKDFGLGAAAIGGGWGVWFGLRKDE